MIGFLLPLEALEVPLQLNSVQPPIELVRIGGHGMVKPFLIGKFEVTQAQFASFIRETGYTGSDHPSSKPTERFLMNWVNGQPPIGKDRYPVCYVNWHHAKAYCAWLAKKSGRAVRLPSDAEWTLAAAGPEGRQYPWGNSWNPRRANYGDGGKVDGYLESSPVGAFPKGATPTGVYDMAGNIWEWSAEGHLRGGPWCMDAKTLLCAIVAQEDTARCDDKFGLRIAVGL